MSQRLNILPQNYPLWVQETYEGPSGEIYYLYIPIVAWAWIEDVERGIPRYLDPIVTRSYGAGVYTGPGSIPGFQRWSITDHKVQKEEKRS